MSKYSLGEQPDVHPQDMNPVTSEEDQGSVVVRRREGASSDLPGMGDQPDISHVTDGAKKRDPGRADPSAR